MISLLSSVVPFIKELVFGKPAEAANDPPSTKAKKWLIFLIVMGSLSLNYFIGNRLYHVSVYQLKLMEQVKMLKTENSELEIERGKVAVMRGILLSCLKDPSVLDRYDGMITQGAKEKPIEKSLENTARPH